MNESKRQQKVAKLLMKDISEILQQDKRNILNNAFVTVTAVKVSPDLSIARIYLSMMMLKDDEKKELIETINDRKKEIRGVLGHKIGKQVRIIPDLFFYVDELEEQASRIDSLIDNLDIPPEEDSSDEDVN